MELPDSITSQYLKYANRIVSLRIVVLKTQFLVLVVGKSGTKVHHWIYEHGWKLCRKCPIS